MYAIVDIETTGGEYNEEGITEIAIYKFDGIKVIDQFISLVNPLKEIQPFVVKLTGINSKMLCNAPKFHEVAKRIVEITKDCILVAHNASFDYRVLKEEFSRLGFNYERQTICTVKLSKILLPNQPSYKLGNLIRNLGIPFSDQHRAHGDAKVTLKLFEILLEKDVKKTIVNKNIERLNFNKKNSNYLKIIDSLPTEMGVYYVYNNKNKIIYIGSSGNIKKQVSYHLITNKQKSIIVQKDISKVTYSITGGKLLTLLKEQNDIKKNRPILNISIKYRIYPVGIKIEENSNYLKLNVEQVKKNENYINVFKNKKLAELSLAKWKDDFGICLKKTSLNNTQMDCFNSKLEQCNNDHHCNESPEKYNLKINNLKRSLDYPYSDFLIIEKGRKNGENSFVFIENKKLNGYGYFDLNHQIKNKSQIKNRIISVNENHDAKKLICTYLSRKKYLKLIHLQ